MPQKTTSTEPKEKTLRITLDIPPSVNHCYAPNYKHHQRDRVLTSQARSWKEYAKLKALSETGGRKIWTAKESRLNCKA